MDKEIKKEKEIKEPKTPEQKKKIRRIVIFGIIAALVLYLVISAVISSHQPMSVAVSKIAIGSITQTVDTSGTVTSMDTKIYFSPIDGTIGNINVAKGDAVKKDDVLFVYDEDKLNESIEVANNKIEAANGSYNNSIQTNNRICSNLSEALTNLPILEDQIAFAEDYINQIEGKISDKKSALSYEGAQLQISLIDWEDQPLSDEYENLRKLVQENQYEQQNNVDIRAWQEELDEANKILSDLKTYQSEMKAQKSSAKDSTMTSGAKTELEANHETNILELTNTIDDYNSVSDGVKAEFNGVITEIDAVEGSLVNKGTTLLKLESTENVVANISLTKYDLEHITLGQKATVTVNGITYDGEVTHINKMAELNNSGASVVGAQVSIKNPDENIVLGIESKVSILVGEADNIVLIPNELVNYDTEGAFVFTVTDNTVSKKHIVLGFSDDTKSEVTQGLVEGDLVISETNDSITEGLTVNPIEQ